MPSEQLPSPGLGTSGNDEFEECAETVETALELGYRHLDTAQMYDNEAAVGEGIRRADVPREDVFLATKVHPNNLAPEDLRETTEESLDRLGVDQVDLLYVHWPTGEYDAETTLSAMNEVQAEGLTRHVGVSNFTPDLLDEAREHLDEAIFANQVECHPLLPQTGLRKYAVEHDHYLVAYSPLIQGRADEVDVLVELARKHDCTPHQVCLAWLLELDNVVPIPQGRGDHLAENWAAREVPLESEDRALIAGIDDRERIIDPDRAPWNQ